MCVVRLLNFAMICVILMSSSGFNPTSETIVSFEVFPNMLFLTINVDSEPIIFFCHQVSLSTLICIPYEVYGFYYICQFSYSWQAINVLSTKCKSVNVLPVMVTAPLMVCYIFYYFIQQDIEEVNQSRLPCLTLPLVLNHSPILLSR